MYVQPPAGTPKSKPKVAWILGCLLCGAVSVAALFIFAGLVALRAFPLWRHPPFLRSEPGANPEGMYKTLAEAQPFSKAEVHDPAEKSRDSMMTVSSNSVNNDSTGSITFGIKWQQKTLFGGSSGGLTSVISATHRYLKDYKHLKVGQGIVFEEVSGDPQPKERYTYYSSDPFQYLRPLPK